MLSVVEAIVSCKAVIIANWSCKQDHWSATLHWDSQIDRYGTTLLFSACLISLNAVFYKACLVLHRKGCNRSISKFLADQIDALSCLLQPQQIFFFLVTPSELWTHSSVGWLLSFFFGSAERNNGNETMCAKFYVVSCPLKISFMSLHAEEIICILTT